MHVTTDISIVLQARKGEHIGDLVPFLKPGCTVQVGRSGAVVAAVSCGDKIAHAEQLENQIVLAESAMRRGSLMQDQDHIPALTRVIGHIPEMYLQVADAIKQQALDDGDDLAMAEEAAGQAIKVLGTFKQKLEKLLEPELLTTQHPGSLITENPVVAESLHIDDRIKQAAENVDPRNLFIKINPIGASSADLEKGARSGFVDDRTHGDYLIFLAGYSAAQGASQ